MFLFWYRFVRPNISGITRGIGETIYYQIVTPNISDFMGHIFEDICIQYLYHLKFMLHYRSFLEALENGGE